MLYPDWDYLHVDLELLAKATSLPVRRLRYVLEHGVVPGMSGKSRGHRVTRHFTPFEAFGVALAVVMLEAGLRRPIAARLLKLIVESRSREISLQSAFERKGAFLEIGDGVNLRIVTGVMASAWIQGATGTALQEYRPLANLRLDLSQLRNAINHAKPR